VQRIDDNSYKTWFGSIYPASRIRYSKNNANIQEGYYDKFTEAQERALIAILRWMKAQAPDVFSYDRVIGHDEACDEVGEHGRKNDPGAALSKTMPELRKYLRE
jgi:hypothetical protein